MILIFAAKGAHPTCSKSHPSAPAPPMSTRAARLCGWFCLEDMHGRLLVSLLTPCMAVRTGFDPHSRGGSLSPLRNEEREEAEGWGGLTCPGR